MHIGYVRVSTDEQVNGYGLDVQETRIRAYATALGYQLNEVISDGGYSGASMDRPGLKRLRVLLASREVQGVIVARLDRLSRSLRNLLNLYADSFETNGAALVSVAESFDTSTPAGRLFFQLVGSFAEFERNVITERLSSGRRQKAAQGGYAGGGAPYGYTATRGSKVLLVNEEQAAVVRRIFALRAQRWTTRRIADALAAGDVPSASGGTWTHRQVARILARKEFYRGGYNYSGVATRWGQHTATL